MKRIALLLVLLFAGISFAAFTPPDSGNSGGTGGAGVSIKGSDTIVNILATSSPTSGDMWLSTDTGVDSNSQPVAVGDGIVYDGTKWLTVGPVRGPAGATGDEGPRGVTGAKGDAGNPGADGSDGNHGANGAPGTNGVTGATGPQGETGADGADGADGANGTNGTNPIVNGTLSGADTIVGTDGWYIEFSATGVEFVSP